MSKAPRPRRDDRRQQAFAFIASCGITGGTWKELSEATGLHHGSASSALSLLHKAGRISRLAEGRREGCLPYVLPELVGGRLTRSAGRRAGKPVQELVDAGWQSGYDAAMAQVEERPSAAQAVDDAYLNGRNRGQHDEALRVLRLVVEMRREIKRTGRVLAHTKTCWIDHPDCALASVEKALARTVPVSAPQREPAA